MWKQMYQVVHMEFHHEQALLPMIRSFGDVPDTCAAALGCGTACARKESAGFTEVRRRCNICQMCCRMPMNRLQLEQPLSWHVTSTPAVLARAVSTCSTART